LFCSNLSLLKKSIPCFSLPIFFNTYTHTKHQPNQEALHSSEERVVTFIIKVGSQRDSNKGTKVNRGWKKIGRENERRVEGLKHFKKEVMMPFLETGMAQSLHETVAYKIKTDIRINS